jgi:hypothetical protein
MKRSLFFADFLGTTESYSFIERVKRRRELLELAVEAYFMPILDEYDLYVYIVSDSLFVTCPTVQPLLRPAARLFKRFLSMNPSRSTEPLRLDLLRGAISYGEAAETTVIKNSRRVIAIPMLDDSLPRATALEKIRPGSRVYLDATVPHSLLRGEARYLLKWRHITGKGDPIANVTEFLWPCMACERGFSELIQSTERIRKDWLALLVTKEWVGTEYDQGLMVQLDETLKLFIRSLARFDDERGVGSYLLSILPTSTRDKSDVKFEWGIWFQALKALCESPTRFGQGKAPVRNRLALVKEILSEETYWESFLTELEKPDYANFKRSVSAML